MGELQDAQKGAEVTSEATERELELEAQLVEARSIIQEQVLYLNFRVYGNNSTQLCFLKFPMYFFLMSMSLNILVFFL